MLQLEDLNRTWPAELVDQIVQEACELARTEADVLTLLSAISRASRDFYISARRLRWRSIKVKYYPLHGEDSEKSRARNDWLYGFLKMNPWVREVVREVELSIVEVANDDRAGQGVEGHPDDTQNIQDPLDLTPDPPAFPTFHLYPERTPPWDVHSKVERDNALTKALCLLSNANVEKFALSVSRLQGTTNAPFGHVPLLSFPDELLFSLTAIRTSPSLKKLCLHLIPQPPHALVFGDPRVDGVKEARLCIEVPQEGVTKDYIVPRGSHLLVDLADDVYLRVVQAIAYFNRKDLVRGVMDPSHPLFPQLESLCHTSYNGGHPLVAYLIELTPLVSSTPLGGHLPAFKTLFLDAPSRYTIIAHAISRGFIRTVAPRIERLVICNQARRCLPRDLAMFKNIISLEFDDIVCRLDASEITRPSWMYADKEPLSSLLPALRSISHSPTLSSLSLGMIIPSLTIGSYIHALQQHTFWSQLDDALIHIAKSISPRRLAVNVKLGVSPPDKNTISPSPSPYPGAEMQSQNADLELGRWHNEVESANKQFAKDVFPKAEAYSGIDLHIDPCAYKR